jgi:hypothetical protein
MCCFNAVVEYRVDILVFLLFGPPFKLYELGLDFGKMGYGSKGWTHNPSPRTHHLEFKHKNAKTCLIRPPYTGFIQILCRMGF